MIPISKKISLINFTDKNDIGRIKFIVIHYFGSLGTAEDVAQYFYNVFRSASAHYCVDENSIWQCVEDEDIAWHCGDSGIGTMKGIVTNSIGIEVRPYKIDLSTVSSAGAQDWYFNNETIKNLSELVIMLMKKYNIPIENVVRHFDVTAKWCPRPWMGDDINTYYKETGNVLWKEFKTTLEGEDNIMQVGAITANMNGQLTELKTILYNDENYIRLRDLADAQKNDKLTVSWNESERMVYINSK
jgi:N-acetyl-anhydromuramyl-L-alanine amidase AmpD